MDEEQRLQEATIRAEAVAQELLREEEAAEARRRAAVAEKAEARRAALAEQMAAAEAVEASSSESSEAEEEDEDEGMLSMLHVLGRPNADKKKKEADEQQQQQQAAAKREQARKAAEGWHNVVRQQVREHLSRLQDASPVADVEVAEVAPLGTHGHVRVSVLLRQQTIGSIIGQGGQTVRDLRALNFAKLEVHARDAPAVLEHAVDALRGVFIELCRR
jgi:predicted RNA-binding protein YlqC (UPF0109 family)